VSCHVDIEVWFYPTSQLYYHRIIDDAGGRVVVLKVQHVFHHTFHVLLASHWEATYRCARSDRRQEAKLNAKWIAKRLEERDEWQQRWLKKQWSICSRDEFREREKTGFQGSLSESKERGMTYVLTGLVRSSRTYRSGAVP
jgi:hypothetical protein